MRRSLTRATAVCAAYALVLVLGAAAPAAADEGVLATADGSAAPGWDGAPGERSGGPRGSHPDAEGTSGPVGPGAASATEGPSGPASPHGERTEVESSAWTYVDRAFPDRPRDGAETASVGTGRLEWDRNYTRRALFRFPVVPGPGAVVESAVLRTEVAWSYDCGSVSFVQLHRVDPFDEGATWNEQPRTRALLDTRGIRGGRSACPVPGGVEFDLTEAYQRAVDAGEPHIHLRLGERDESGTTAWRRFDVEDHPPVLVVDHGTPPSPDATADPNALRSDPEEDAADDGAPAGRAAVHGEGSPEPAPTTRFAQGLDLPGVTAPGARGDHYTRVPGLVSADRLPDGGERIRPRRGRRIGHPTAGDGHRRRDGDTPPRARGPPLAARSETVSVHRS
ncbi:DNRLRE domain-containing protein [Nocardiopsis akebiae]|uniref:DNRLRE domain-containing protein n=1 Tax=Nocardiopsis akebiae TaxID=2831968 RepID=A0ABX8C3P4_9ACTN|nr:DNRLRE domain-containing protein [Nocardiopsis akebiae]QUX28072.1 DNRLRE domain-containing protein [Nocardiopsis akebiae]